MESNIRFPKVEQRLGLGVGMDLPWGQRIGFSSLPKQGGKVTPKVERFLDKYHEAFSYLFVAYQPRNKSRLRVDDYIAAYDHLFFEAAADIKHRAFHHTLLNLGTLENYERQEIADFTNALIERYGFLWVVEDLGVWSIDGKSLPYPLPPFMTEEGLAAAIRNVSEWQRLLTVPLCVEFPGFTEGATFFIGELDAYDFFRRLAEETGSPVTIDIGHILSYQWLKGRTGDRLTEGVHRLPLANCFEIHLSGCQITGDKFRDLHHGVLLDEQLELLEFILPLCPNARAITYEDPQYTDDGLLVRKSVKNYQRLRNITEGWAG